MSFGPLLQIAGISDAIQHRPLVAVPLLFAAGVLTSLTPCVYPMIPITVGVIGGNAAARSRRRTTSRARRRARRSSP